ncbi:MAG: hypothetical protein ACI9YM_000488 [Brevundimonas sp.]|jgi:hypothetical protein|uniref:hypothetical protein n=1 Tax=Brevundimonas sp. TaxID=1871086 RepID=UPI002486F39F|nr:hypothetical protein [Brevundimonas sp.]MDI1282556.1 hypothetical protein [Brevundimonas sp.]
MRAYTMTTVRRATVTVLLASGLALTGAVTAAVAQAPPMLPITQLDSAAQAYITSNGSSIARLGESNPDRLIGRAMPCRAGADATYTMAPGTAYPMPEGTRYVADATSRQEPLTILAQGVLQGKVGAGPVTAEASADKLTRLDITEAVRLSINTADAQGALSRAHLRFLNDLTGTLPAGYGHWCVITGASVWNVRYETYDKKRVVFGLPEGLWIATASGDYTRNASAVVPYQVVTIAVTQYPASWVQAQAGAAVVAAVVPPPAGQVPVRSLVGALTPEALAAGDRIGEQVSDRVALEDLLANRDIRDRLLADPALREDLRRSPEL